MKLITKFWLLGIILIATGSVVGGLFGRIPSKSAATSALTREDLVRDFGEALKAVDENYIDDVDREEALDSSIQSMLWTLDPHSSFFTKDELRKLYEEQASQFYGIGVSILQ